MTDKELIKNLKQLKQIKPNQDWVAFSKSQILGQEAVEVSKLRADYLVSLFQKLALLFSNNSNKLKPAYAIITLLVLLIVGVGFVLIEKETSVKMVEAPIIEPTDKEILEKNIPEKVIVKTEEQKEIVLVLKNLQAEMTQVTEEINQVTEEIKKIEGPQQALEVRNDVIPKLNAARNTLAENRNIVAEKIKRTELESKEKQNIVLATEGIFNETEKIINETEKLSNNVNKKIAGQLIKDLETRTLTEVQQEILEKAKIAYQNGDYHIALINAMHVRQNIERLSLK